MFRSLATRDKRDRRKEREWEDWKWFDEPYSARATNWSSAPTAINGKDVAPDLPKFGAAPQTY